MDQFDVGADNFINFDIADTIKDEVDQSTDQNHDIDIENLLRVNIIANNCSKNKTYLDLDTKMIENFITENFMNFDITDIETDRVEQLETNVFSTFMPSNTKKDINKLVTIAIDSDSENFEGEVNSDEIGRKKSSVGISQSHNILSPGNFNEEAAKPELPAEINNNIKDLLLSNDSKKVYYNTNESPIVTDSDSEREGYHSSDFEFITENEAKQAGLTKNNNQKRSKLRQKQIDRIENPKPIHNADQRQPIGNSKYWSKSYNRRLVVEQYYKDLKNNRDNHEIPQGDAYLNMFQGIHASTSMFLENKSVTSSACMTIQDFDLDGMRRMGNRDESMDKQLQEQAKENSKRILEKYPGQNRRKSRRF